MNVQATPDEPRVDVRMIQDRDVLRTLLSKDHVGGAYPLGYLDDAYFHACKWWGVYQPEKPDEPQLLLVLYSGLSMPVAITVGDASLVSPLLRVVYHDLPDRFFCHVREEHLEGVRDWYDTNQLKSTVRNSLQRDKFKKVDPDANVMRLGHRDTAHIVKLYEHYPDNYFEPYQLESGYYFGIHERPGGPLVSIAGIHVISKAYDVAVLGNIVTHPDHRGKHLAARVVGRLLNELFDRVSLAVINHSADNLGAARTIKHFKFKRNHTYWQGLVRRAF